MTRSRIIDRQSSIHQTASTKRRVRRPHPAEFRPTLERLEVRNLLSVAGNSMPSALAAPAADPTSSVLAINGFDGMNSQVGNFITYPDTTGAVGPSSYVEAVNTAVQIYNKDGTTLAPSTQFSSFFSSLGNTHNFSNPHVVYNELTQRFFIGVQDYSFSGPRIGYFDVAISTSPNPTTLTSSDWNFYRYNGNDSKTGYDQPLSPAVGYNAEGYVVTFDEYTNGQFFNHSAVLAIRNDGSTSAGNQAVPVPGGFGNYSLAPASMHDLPSSPDQPMWMVETVNSFGNAATDQIIVAEMDNPFSSPTWTFTYVNVAPFLGNPSGLGGIRSVNTTMTFSALRTVDGVTHLVAADNTGEQNSSGTKVGWYDVNVTDPSSVTLYQQGVIDPGPGINASWPSADIAPDGAIGMTYAQSLPSRSSDPRAGITDMYVTGRLPTDPLGTLEPPVAAKLGPGVLNTFGGDGEYSSTTIDPADGTFWSANEYSSASVSTPNWATWIQHFAVGRFEVTSSSPANGSTVPSSPSSYVISFSSPVDPTSLKASDLTVDGHPATAVTLSADQQTATFIFATNPAPNQGLHALSIAAGLIAEQGNPNVSNLAYNASYRYDAIIIAPSSTNPPTTNGVFLLPGPLTYDITFNEPVDPATVTTSDLILSGIPGATVTGATVLPGDTTAQFTISGITSEGMLNIAYQAGAFTDQYGNPGPGFSANYIVAFGTVPFPTPLSPVQPQGSLIYEGSQSGLLQFTGETDHFTLPVDSGQTVTLVLTTSPSLEGTLSVAAGKATVATATAAAGQDVVIQTIKAPGQLGDGSPATNYTFSVGSATGALGSYTLEVILNAALENESVGGPSDNTTATAQDLTNSFVLLHSAGQSQQQPARAAVLGSLTGPAIQATVPESLENVDTDWGNTFPFILQPWGDSSMRYQQIYSASEMNGGGIIDQVRFRRAEFSSNFPDFQTNVTVLIGYAAVTYDNASYQFDSNLGAGVITAYDGPLTIPGSGNGSPTNPFNIVVNLTSDFTYDPTKGDLIVEFDVHSSTANVVSYFSTTDANSFDPTTRIWSPSDTATQGNVDYGYGLVTQFGYVTDSTDDYRINVDAGQSLTVAATSLSGASVQVALLDPNGNTLALGSDNGTVVNTISDFVATASGTYYLQVTGTGIAQYSLVVTRNADFDAQTNHSIATAQELISPEVAGRRWVLGAIQPSQSDYYTITATDSTPIEVEANTPASSSGQFADDLAPALFLYDAAGNLVASAGTSAAGSTADLDYNVPTGLGGVYYIEVAASTTTSQPTSGEYVLSVKGATGASPPVGPTSTIPADAALLPAAPLGDAQEQPPSMLPSGLPAVVPASSAGSNPNVGYQASDLAFQDQQWLADLLDQARGVSAATPFGVASSAKADVDG